MEYWHWWLIAAIVLMTLEILSGDFLVGTFGVACLAGSLAAGLGATLNWQLGAFSVASILTLAFIRPAVRKWLYRSSEPANTNVEGMKGATGTITDPVGGVNQPGRVKIGGEEWRAVSESGAALEEGMTIEVVSVDSATVVVREKG